MNIEHGLIRAAAQFGVRITVTVDDNRRFVIDSPDVRALGLALARITDHTIDVQTAKHLLGMHRRVDNPVMLTEREAAQLMRALDDIYQTRERAAKIDRGQIPGNLTSVEALRLARRFGCRR